MASSLQLKTLQTLTHLVSRRRSFGATSATMVAASLGLLIQTRSNTTSPDTSTEAMFSAAYLLQLVLNKTTTYTTSLGSTTLRVVSSLADKNFLGATDPLSTSSFSSRRHRSLLFSISGVATTPAAAIDGVLQTLTALVAYSLSPSDVVTFRANNLGGSS